MTKLLLDLLWSHSCNKQIPCENTGGNSGLDFIINLCGWILSEQPRLGMENFRTERIKVRDNSNTAATSICHLSQDHSGVDKVWAGIKWGLLSWLRHDHWWESRGEFEQNKLARKETNWEVLRLLRRKYNSVSILPLIQSVSQIVSILLVFLSFPQLQIIATMSANWIKTSLRFLYLFLFLSSCPPKFGTIFEISNCRRLNLVTVGNQAEIVLHTDSTVRAAGFELLWRTQLVSPCEAEEEVEAEAGEISLPDMETGQGYQLPYNCSVLLSAPGKAREGKWWPDLWLTFIFVSVNFQIVLNLSVFNFGSAATG